jgi:hypothetical protein
MLFGMLQENPDRRSSLDDILNCEWMNEEADDYSKDEFTNQTRSIVELLFTG